MEVTNNLQDMSGITFHWHGVHQRKTPVMDGAAMVTQCPIVFGTTFTYEFHASPAGTHLWHSHISSNRADGLAGALIIRDSVRTTFFFSTDETFNVDAYFAQFSTVVNATGLHKVGPIEIFPSAPQFFLLMYVSLKNRYFIFVHISSSAIDFSIIIRNYHLKFDIEQVIQLQPGKGTKAFGSEYRQDKMKNYLNVSSSTISTSFISPSNLLKETMGVIFPQFGIHNHYTGILVMKAKY